MKVLRSRDLYAMLLLLFLDLVFFWKVVLLGEIALPANVTWDPAASLYPLKLAATTFLRAGTLPLWNPYILGGTPLLADVFSAAFSPLDLPFLAFPTPLGYSSLLMGYIFLGGVFTYLLLREFCSSRFGPLVGAIVLMFNGTIIGVLEWRTHVATVLWLPLILLLLEKAISHRTLPWVIFAGMAMAGQWLAGHTQSALYTQAIALFFVVFRLFQLRRQGRTLRLRAGLLSLLPFALGIGLGAIQLIPSLELTLLSSRDIFVAAQYPEDGWPLRRIVVYLITLFFPEAFMQGDLPVPANPLLQTYDLPPRGYLGLLPFVFVFIAVFHPSPDRRARFFPWLAGGFILFFVLLATPLRDAAIAAFPPFGLFLHRKAITLFFVLLAVLAGLGADSLVSSPKSRQILTRTVRLLGIGWALALLAGTAATLFFTVGGAWLVSLGKRYVESHGFGTADHPESAQFYYQKVEFYVNWFGQQMSFVNTPLFMPLALGGLSLLALWLGSKGRLRPLAFRTAIVAIVFLDLFYLGTKYLPTIDSVEALYPRQQAVAYLQERQAQGETFRVVSGIAEVGPPAARPQDSYQPFRKSLHSKDVSAQDKAYYADTLLPFGIPSVIGYESLTIGRYADFMLSIDPTVDVTNLALAAYDSPLLDMLNARYFLSTVPLTLEKLTLLLDGPVKLYENTKAMPQVWIVPAHRVLPKGQVLAALHKTGFDPNHEVLLEKEPLPLEAITGNAKAYRSTITATQANRVTVQAELQSPGYLVFANTFYPGWKAYVDGKPRPVQVANYVQMSVPLEAGGHTVEFLYDPWSFKLGVGISLSTLALSIVGLCFAAMTRKSKYT